ncbi:epidermal growth factor receptor [Mytilus galloprovincialis]|nr:epidermal growth factor receptor [Mytilus galloprovincialis]
MFLNGGFAKTKERTKRQQENASPIQVCRGTKMGMSVSGTSQDHYDLYKRRYTNCTYVDGNLEITYLDKNKENSDWDLTFFESIEEVSGYVLIYSVFTQELHLRNLCLIRGNQLFSFKGEKLYSLAFISNSKPGSTTRGLMYLGLKSLQEIMNGIVYFYNNNLLCYEQTIHWADINPSVTPHAKYSFNSTYHKRNCGECHPACYNMKTDSKQCWGEGPDMCQTLNHAAVCSYACEHRCFGSYPNQCCHPECAAGCRGLKHTDCHACKHFSNDGECVRSCPPHQVYNPVKFKMDVNPEGKFAYENHMLKDTELNICVKTCRTKFKDVNGTCVECDGSCSKACKGQSGGEYITASNINQFENCTIVNGNLKILEASFAGDTQYKTPGVTVDDLQVLKSIKEVTGYIMIQSNHTNFRNLSFLSNLEVIHGREVDATQSSLNIMFTPLRNLDLISLRQIQNGHVTIAFNHHLCYISDINFTSMFVHKNIQTVRKMKNKKAELCRDEGEVCDQSCSDDGCWFKGSSNCLQCRKFKIDNSSNICINDCIQLPGLYEVGHLCKVCDEECESTCSGLGPENCHKCKHNAVTGTKKDGNMITKCLKECPEMFYPDHDRICQKCHDFCDDGCSGPSDTVTDDGCKSCKIGIEGVRYGESKITCMDPNEESCPVGFYRHTVSRINDPLTGKMVCKRCNEMCNDCTGAGSAYCITCRFVKQFGYCVENCYPLFYPASNQMCQQCHEQCRGSCFGPSASDCKACLSFKVYWDDTDNPHRFNCTKTCPDAKKYHVESDDFNDEGLIVCASASHPKVQTRFKADKAEAELMKNLVITGGVIVFVATAVVLGVLLRRRFQQNRENMSNGTTRMTAFENEVANVKNKRNVNLVLIEHVKFHKAKRYEDNQEESENQLSESEDDYEPPAKKQQNTTSIKSPKIIQLPITSAGKSHSSCCVCKAFLSTGHLLLSGTRCCPTHIDSDGSLNEQAILHFKSLSSSLTTFFNKTELLALITDIRSIA